MLENDIQDFLQKHYLPINIIDKTINDIFQYIYQNNTFYQNKIKNSKVYKKRIFKTICLVLFSKMQIYNQFTIYLNKNMKKRKMINFVFDLLFNTNIFAKKYDKQVLKIQRFVRNYIYKKITKYTSFSSENITDPFTLDNINEIPLQNLFCIKDDKSHIYKFDAIELEYYISNIQNINPYTKQPFSDIILCHLSLFINYNQLNRKVKQDFKWDTYTQAYTEASQVMEAAGFYNDVRWFEKMSYEDVKNTISLFQLLSLNTDQKFFSSDINQISYQFDFANGVIELFQNYNDNYLHCCNFMKALSSHSDDFFQNLPRWLYTYDTYEISDDLEFLTLIYYFSIE